MHGISLSLDSVGGGPWAFFHVFLWPLNFLWIGGWIKKCEQIQVCIFLARIFPRHSPIQTCLNLKENLNVCFVNCLLCMKPLWRGPSWFWAPLHSESRLWRAHCEGAWEGVVVWGTQVGSRWKGPSKRWWSLIHAGAHGVDETRQIQHLQPHPF